MKIDYYIASLFVLLPFELMAKPKYTHIESTLGFPWFMFFVFLVLIMIPFVLIITLSWRKTDK